MVTVVIWICLIFLGLLLLKRSGKLVEHPTLTTAATLVGCWIAAIIGTIEVNSELSYKIAIVSIATLILVTSSIYLSKDLVKQSTFKLKDKSIKQIGIDEEVLVVKKSDLLFWVIIMAEIFDAAWALSLGIVFWSIFSINGVAVVTYGNLVSISYFAIAAILTFDVRRRARRKQLTS